MINESLIFKKLTIRHVFYTNSRLSSEHGLSGLQAGPRFEIDSTKTSRVGWACSVDFPTIFVENPSAFKSAKLGLLVIDQKIYWLREGGLDHLETVLLE